MLTLDNKQDPNKKTHWFHLGYMVPTPGAWVPVSVTSSYIKRILCSRAMQALREVNGLPQSAVLMNVSYLGYASKHHMAGTSDKPVPTQLSDAYRQGLSVAFNSEVPVADVVNPYTAIRDQSAEAALFETEWDAGLKEGISIKEATLLQNPAKVLGT